MEKDTRFYLYVTFHASILVSFGAIFYAEDEDEDEAEDV